MPQTEIEETVAARDVDEMAQYFSEEPWGPWRDNVHAALIIKTLRDIHRPKGAAAADWKDFMLMDQGDRRRERLGKFVAWMRGLAKPKPASD